MLALCGTQVLAQQEFDDAKQLEDKLLSDILNLKGKERAIIPEEQQSFPPRIQDLLSAGILKFLNSGATAAEVQRKLESILADPDLVNESGNVSVLAFGENRSSTFVIAYGIPYCVMCNRTWLGTYERISGSYSNTYAINGVLDNHTIYLHVLPGDGIKQRFVLYGTGLGSPHNPLTVKAYQLSAGSLREFWMLDGLGNGTIQFHDDEILARYIALGKTTLAPRKARVDKYLVTTEGVRLESRSEHAAE